ncbi:MAG: hypothetical protein R3F35_07335 [Myxococcota bacterium]
MRSVALLVLVSCLISSCRLRDERATESPAASRSGLPGDRLERILADRFDPQRRSRALGRLLAETDPADAVELQIRLTAASPYAHPSDLEQFAWWWAGHDPVAAMQSPVATSTVSIDFWQTQVLRAWAARDPAAASEGWKAGLCQGAQDYCLLALVAGWSDSGDGSVWNFVRDLGPGVLQQRALDVLAARLVADRGIEEALRFAEATDADAPHRFKLQLFRRMVTAIALRDVERAASWAERQSGGPFGDGLLRRVAVRWVTQEGSAGMTWLMSLPTGPQRDDAVQAAAYRWFQSDRAAALGWFEAAEDHPALEPAWPTFAQVLVEEDPARALAVVGRIDDPDQRDRTLVTVLRRWRERSPESAEDWLARQALPESIVARVRAESPQPGSRSPRDR